MVFGQQFNFQFPMWEFLIEVCGVDMDRLSCLGLIGYRSCEIFFGFLSCTFPVRE